MSNNSSKIKFVFIWLVLYYLRKKYGSLSLKDYIRVENEN